MKWHEWMKWPALIIGFVAAIVVASRVITRFATMPEAFDTHLTAFQSHVVTEADSLRALGVKASEIDHHLEAMQRVQGGMRRERSVEQCMENSWVLLGRQQLLATCDSLGIHRRAGDRPPSP